MRCFPFPRPQEIWVQTVTLLELRANALGMFALAHENFSSNDAAAQAFDRAWSPRGRRFASDKSNLFQSAFPEIYLCVDILDHHADRFSILAHGLVQLAMFFQKSAAAMMRLRGTLAPG